MDTRLKARLNSVEEVEKLLCAAKVAGSAKRRERNENRNESADDLKLKFFFKPFLQSEKSLDPSIRNLFPSFPPLQSFDVNPTIFFVEYFDIRILISVQNFTVSTCHAYVTVSCALLMRVFYSLR